MENILNNITFAFVKTKYSQNIGFAARILNNFGIKNILLVAPRCGIDKDAYRVATDGAYLLEKIGYAGSMKDLRKNFDFLVATTGVKSNSKRNFFYAGEGAEFIVKTAALGKKTAVVFGPEDNGLSNDELCLADHFITLNTGEEFPSLNLSHCAGIIAYEIFNKAFFPLTPKKKMKKGEIHNILKKMADIGKKTGYMDEEDKTKIYTLFEKVFSNLKLTDYETKVMFGYFKKIKEKLNDT